MEDKKTKILPPNPYLNTSFTLKGYLMAKMRRMYRREKFELLKPIVKAITSKWFINRQFISLDNYQTLNPEKVEVLIHEKTTLKYSSIKFFGKNNDERLYEIKSRDKYLVKLNDVTVIGCSDLIILDAKYVLYDLKFLDIEQAFDYTDDAIKFSKENFCILESQISPLSYNEAILLNGNYSSNYYHFLLEIISKFELLSRTEIDKNVPILIDQSCLDLPQYKELLAYFNTDKREIIPLEKEIKYRVAKVYHISCPNIIPPNFKDITNIKASHNLFDTDSLIFVRERLLGLIKRKDWPKRIFISRKNASGRREYNEEEVYNLLNTLGFTVMYPEEYSIIEQVEIFNNAEFIVGATGAAFTNLLFCKPSCKIICLTNFSIDVSIFSTIAKFLEFELVYLYDEQLVLHKDAYIHSAFKIEVAKLEEAILEVFKLSRLT